MSLPNYLQGEDFFSPQKGKQEPVWTHKTGLLFDILNVIVSLVLRWCLNVQINKISIPLDIQNTLLCRLCMYEWERKREREKEDERRCCINNREAKTLHKMSEKENLIYGFTNKIQKTVGFPLNSHFIDGKKKCFTLLIQMGFSCHEQCVVLECLFLDLFIFRLHYLFIFWSFSDFEREIKLEWQLLPRLGPRPYRCSRPDSSLYNSPPWNS